MMDLSQPLGELEPAPHDDDAERALLGCLLLAPDLVDVIGQTITGPDFHQPAHEAVWGAISDLHRAGAGVDVILVHDYLRSHGQGHLVRDGLLGLHAMVEAVTVAADAPAYARIVQTCSRRRRMIEASTKIRQLGNRGGDIDDLAAQARATLDQIDQAPSRRTITGADAMAALVDRLGSGDDMSGLPTPWPDLNRCIGGLQGGRLYVLAARPAVGKSLMAQGLAEHWIGHHEQRVLYSTLEMPARELAMRMLSHRSQVSMSTLKASKHLTEGDWALIAKATSQSEAAQKRLVICDEASQSAESVRLQAKAMQRDGGLGMVVVDYLQLLDPPTGGKNRNREREVADISRAFKALAMDLDVPVVLVSQLNRASLARADKRPAMSDLRESGAIEQDSDVIVMLHEPDPDERPNQLEVLIVKQRDGSPGDVEMFRRGWTSELVSPLRVMAA